MRLIMLAAALAAGTAAHAKDATHARSSSPTPAVIVEAKRAIADLLRDPSAAQFRGVHTKKADSGILLVCGEVNGKNAYGGYVGFKAFVYMPITSQGFIAVDDPTPEQLAAQNNLIGPCFY